MLGFGRPHEAHGDARLVFRAAAEERPLELQRRLVLGGLAGGRFRTRGGVLHRIGTIHYMIIHV